MKDGKKYYRYTDKFPRLSSAEEIKDKFRSCVAFAPESLPARNSKKIIDMVDNLEAVKDVSELIKLLVRNPSSQ